MTEKEKQESPTWPSVLRFAERMEAKLALNRHKGDRQNWINSNPRELHKRIHEECIELSEAIQTGSAEEIANECADVANFSMMVADWYVEHSGSAGKKGAF